jgi:hypothetical protein
VYCVGRSRVLHLASSFMKPSTDLSVNRSGAISGGFVLTVCAQCLTFHLPAVVHITLNSVSFVRAALPSWQIIKNTATLSGTFRQNVPFVCISKKYSYITNVVSCRNLRRHPFTVDTCKVTCSFVYICPLEN